MARIIKNPKVSVVLPIKEVELTFLEKSVNSILTQSLSDLELIVVNESKESEIVNWLKKLQHAGL